MTDERLKKHKEGCNALHKYYIPECPECGTRISRWRQGVGFVRERICEKSHVWVPGEMFGKCTCELKKGLKNNE